MTDAAGMSTDTADAALTALAADIVEQISVAKALELAAGLADPPRSADWRTLTPRQLGLAEAANPDYRKLSGIPPLTGKAGKSCGFCGGVDDLEAGPDQRHAVTDDWLCRDLRSCISRRERRWPPRADLVPEGVLAVLAAADEADAARLSRQAAQQPAPEPAAAQPGPESQQEPQEGWQQPPGWQVTQFGAYDTNGTWHPALPRFDAYAHTLMHPGNRAHLLSGQARPHYYGGANYIPPGVLSAAQGSQEAQEGQGTSREIPPEGLPEGVRQAIEGRALAADIPMAPAAAVAPQRPARSRSRRTRWR